MGSSDSGAFCFIVNDCDDDQRLDTVVARHIVQCSRTRAAGLIRGGFIRLNRHEVKPSQRVHSGEEVCGQVPLPEPVEITPEPIEIDTLYRDDAILVLNKPAGLVVHPAPGHETGTLVHGLLYHFSNFFSVGGQLRPGIVHRLDKDTSGCLVVAFNDRAHENLSRQFKARTTYKKYLALVHGRIVAHMGSIDRPIGRHPVDRKKMTVGGRHARTAHTRWQVEDRYSTATLIKLYLKTGRTHQIRVHLSALGHSVVGDSVYGSRRSDRTLEISPGNRVPVPRQMLHARRLGFDHPVTGKKMVFEAPIPADMAQLINELRRHIASLERV